MSYTETLIPTSVDNLLKCSIPHLCSVLWDEGEELNKAMFAFKDKREYVNFLVGYLSRVKRNGYKNKAKYFEDENGGRQFVKGFGIQKLIKKIRGYLVGNDVYDYDMKNAHPTLLKFIATRDCADVDVTYLNSYIDDRENILKNNNLTKQEVINTINKDNYRGKNSWLKQFHKEIKKIQDNITRKYPLLTTTSKFNKKGSILNKVLCIEENKILNLCIDGVPNVSALMFDGFMCDKDDLTPRLNELSKDWGISWLIKPHQPFTFEEPEEEDKEHSYNSVKEEFEKTHFIILRPLFYCSVYEVDGEKMIQKYSKYDILNVYEPKFYIEMTWSAKEQEYVPEKKGFMLEWLADNNRREYERFDFIPPPLVCPKNVYNLFTGFMYNTYKVEPDNNIDIFLNHIRLLSGDEQTEEVYDYVLNYLAHLIQKPAELPKTALLFKSVEGIGKNIFFDNVGRNILGYKYTLCTAKADDIIGKFNMLDKKFLVTWNECSGRDTQKEQEQIKEKITEPMVTWEEKGKQKIDMKNVMRLIFFTNNNNPIKPSPTDRRMMVIECSNNIPSPEYFKELYDALNNKAQLLGFINFLKKRDLTNWQPPRDRVLTGFHEELSSKSVPHFDKFIIYFIKRDGEGFGEITRRARTFYEDYEDWCKCKNYNPNTMTSFGRQMKKIDGITYVKQNYVKYTINMTEVVEYLYNRNYICEDEKLELLCDDVELEDGFSSPLNNSTLGHEPPQ